MRICLYIMILFLAVAPVMAQAQEQPRFFQELNDVPLMPGLYELSEESLIFDKASGRIGEASAVGDNLGAEDIRAFYAQTLPQLGWTKTADDRYVRDNEALDIVIGVTDGYNVVRFSVAPR